MLNQSVLETLFDGGNWGFQTGIGDLPGGGDVSTRIGGSTDMKMSAQMAERYWRSSDGAVLVKDDRITCIDLVDQFHVFKY